MVNAWYLRQARLFIIRMHEEREDFISHHKTQTAKAWSQLG